jgi:hypothetical protein
MTAPLVDTSDVASQLHQVSASDMGLLASKVLTASRMIRDMCLPVEPATVTDLLDGGAPTVVLKQFPVNTIISVTTYDASGPTTVMQAGGTTGLSDGWYANLNAGVLRRVGYYTWPGGFGNIQVVYTVGPATVPEDVTEACVILSQHLWESRRLEGSARRGQPQDTYTPELEIPPRVYELLRNWLKPARVA